MADVEIIAAILAAGMQTRIGELKPQQIGKPPINLTKLVVRQYQDILRELKNVAPSAARK
ncbi:MAG: hypothetical protein A3H94_04635 [Acidobacteria bacterium RIFCSPLOWO2_02_FULL_60_20]|nr:MAG: hypothetical protein A3H94_04635 [Acidobacteria bacterium RIFCSPLOWO2_02_FULL_60_20]